VSNRAPYDLRLDLAQPEPDLETDPEPARPATLGALDRRYGGSPRSATCFWSTWAGGTAPRPVTATSTGVFALSKTFINWASILEPNTKEQAIRTATMAFTYPHFALMSDAHLEVIWTLRNPIRCADQAALGASERVPKCRSVHG
jgi:hypothetical protein